MRVQWIFRPRTDDVDREALTSEVEVAVGRLDPSVAPRIKLTATHESPPRWTVIPFSSRPLVLVSVDAADRDALAAAAADAGLTALTGAAYERFDVTTSEPVAPPGPPKAGATTAGVELLTLLRRKKGLDDETFIRRWHGGHTPLSLEIHPLAGYIRNVVDARSPDATPLDGIVEEHFHTARDLLNPAVFFAGPVMMLPNMLRVAWDIWGFIDLATIETYWVQERWLRVG